MNWPRIILDGLTMALVFNAVALLGFLVVPQAYSTMFPKDIKEAAAPYVEKKDVRIMKWILHPLYILLVLFWGISARGHDRFLAAVLGRLCGDDPGERYRLHHPGLHPAAEDHPYDQRRGGLQGLGTEGMAENAGHSGTRTDVDPGDVPPGGTVRGRHRPADRAVLLTDSVSTIRHDREERRL